MKILKDQSIYNHIIIIAIFLAFLSFLTDFENTIKFGGKDLRTRVVGSRLVADQFDPYFFKWNENISDFYLDPGDSPYSPVSRVTVTPTVLMLHSIIAKIPYKIQRLIWFILQWIFFISILYLFSKTSQSAIRTKLIWIIGLFFISGSFYWRFHVQRGQIYILYVFLLTLSYWILQKNFKNNDLISGIIVGITTTLYPLIVLMNIPFIVFKKWKLLLGNLIGVFAGFSISIILIDMELWKKYISAMYVHCKINFGWIDTYGFYSKLDAEGMKNFYIWDIIPSSNSSLFQVVKYLSGTNFISTVYVIVFIVFLTLSIILLYLNRNKKVSINMLFFISLALVYSTEFLLPTVRQSFHNIFWIIPLLLTITAGKQNYYFLKPNTIFLIIGLIFSVSFHLLPYSSLICDYSILGFISLTTLLLIRNKVFL